MFPLQNSKTQSSSVFMSILFKLFSLQGQKRNLDPYVLHQGSLHSKVFALFLDLQSFLVLGLSDRYIKKRM